MKILKKIYLHGRLSSDPRPGFCPGGIRLSTFKLSIPRLDAPFIIRAYGALAEQVLRFLHTGDEVTVSVYPAGKGRTYIIAEEIRVEVKPCC